MKNLIIILILSFFSSVLMAQAPAQINYQGVARNSVGTVLSNKPITLRLTVREGSANGAILYRETRNLQTNGVGLFTVAIGSNGASGMTGSLQSVDWSQGGDKFLQVEMDPVGGNNLIDMGTSQLLSVPYALSAGSAKPTGNAGGDLNGTYPNPTIKPGAVNENKIADGAIKTNKIADEAVTLIKIAPGVIPTTLPPNGAAGGDLDGTYPNPSIKTAAITAEKIEDGAIINSKIPDGSITAEKLAPGVIPTGTGGNPSGNAGGDLNGTYPNPTVKTGAIDADKLADGAVNTDKIVDASVTSLKIAPGVIPTSLPPNGAAGGDLNGNYPDPVIKAGVVDANKLANDAVTTNKIQDGAIITSKLVDGSVTAEKLAPGLITTGTGGSPTGTAGGDLNGTYPNPTINAGAVDANKISTGAVTTIKVADGAITSSKLAPGLIPTSLPPTGTAGGDLNGTYPNPTINAGAVDANKISTGAVTTIKVADGAITSAKLAPGLIPTSLPPTGTAGGDLNGTYPNPTINAGAVDANKLSNGAVTTAKVQDASITLIKIAPGVIPTSLPPMGTAGGDLSGTYPDPIINAGAVDADKLANGAVTTDKILDGAIITSKVADGSITAEKLAPGVISTGTGGSPSGPAGGDLSGTYPSPNIKSGAITQSKIANGSIITPKIADGAVNSNKLADGSVSTIKIEDGAVTALKLAPGLIPTSLPPNGVAGGDLSGNYPNPTIKAGVITTEKIADGSITADKLAPGVISGSGGSPTGTAGGDLSGTYPNPTINTGAVSNLKIADGAVSTNKVANAAITSLKIAPGVIPTSLPPNGTAGGDLSGTYPNPTINTGAVSNLKIADGAVSTNKVADAAITSLKIAPGVIPTSLPPNGTAGGDLSGSYPNPTINTGAVSNLKIADGAVSTNKVADAAITSLKIAPGVIPTSLPPNGTAGGDLSGSYPNPTINTGAVSNLKIADGAVSTNKVADAAITSLKIAPGVIPANLPPSGVAGGDLGGNYPNPSVMKIQGTGISNTAPVAGQVLKFDGTQWGPGSDNGGSGSFTLPYIASEANTAALISLTNTSSGAGLEAINSSTSSNIGALTAWLTAASPGTGTAAIKGTVNSTGANGVAVFGNHLGSGFGVLGNSVGLGGAGVFGSSVDGYGLSGISENGSGVFATSNGGPAGFFDIPNPASFADGIYSSTMGLGNGVSAFSENWNGVVGISNSLNGAGVFGMNFMGGESVVGMGMSDIAGAVVGRNDGLYAGIKGMNTANNGVGILAQANTNGASGGTALVAELEGAAAGNIAVFKHNSANVARIDQTGKGYFNGGTQVSGADVAELFEAEGNHLSYEPGDVLVISQSSDRKIEKSSTPYSTLVAGVYATKPGLLLTEENAENDQLDHLVPMGVIGVIPTKVCLEGGIIRRGDLLVSSSTPGAAMKADPDRVKVGQVIGKALQDFDGSEINKINVLVSVK